MPDIDFFWDDFVVGDVQIHGQHTMDQEEILDFAHQFDPQRFHTDPQWAESSIYGGLIASGWHTCGVVVKMVCDDFLLRTSSQGSPGLDQLRWIKPVRPADTLRARCTVMDKRLMQSKPHLGLVRLVWEGINQRDEVVVSMDGWSIYGRRPPPTS
ncbi:MAG: MaoC family dehydratase [Alphaproteobacteria bacterium]|nr:MaoC family dehydratase [Alphaproteobacteria bacterium]